MAKVRTTHIGGSRFYVDTETMAKVPGVTSVIGMLSKPFLQHWSAKMTAELAVDSLDYLPALAKRDRDGAVDFLKGAARRYTSERAKIGSEAHTLFELIARGEDLGPAAETDEMRPYVAHFREFMEKVNPEFVSLEDVCWSDTHGYAGSSDAFMRIWLDEETNKPTPDRSGTPLLVVADWKTSRDVHAEVALQTSAYAHADRLIDAEGNSTPMPKVDGGAVVHITPEKWSLRLLNIDTDTVFSVFLALKQAHMWDRETKKTVVSRPVVSNSRRTITGTERRAR